MNRRLTVFLVLLALTAMVGVSSFAQCIGDDGLAGPCYSPAKANLPQFPAYKSKSKWIPYFDCKVHKVLDTTLVLPAPQQVSCGIFIMKGVDLRMPTGMPLWDTSAIWFLHYTRTWMETDMSSTQPTRYQVWRFLINADVRPSQQVLATPQNPANDFYIPPCIYNSPNGQPVHYWGYLDYAFDCLNQRWSIAFGVNHMCDVFTHNALSAYPMGGHPQWSYAVVAPANFVPATTLPGIQGVVQAEAFRENRIPMLPLCETEQDIASGQIILTNVRKCPCGQNSSPTNQFIEHLTRASTKCKSSAISMQPFPFFWGGSVQMSVGTFTGPGYPGKEELYFIVDPMWYLDGITSPPTQTGELFYGVGTQEGFEAFLFKPGLPPARSFVDQGNVRRLPYFWFFSGMAGLYVSTKLIYLNTF